MSRTFSTLTAWALHQEQVNNVRYYDLAINRPITVAEFCLAADVASILFRQTVVY